MELQQQHRCYRNQNLQQEISIPAISRISSARKLSTVHASTRPSNKGKGKEMRDHGVLIARVAMRGQGINYGSV